MRRGALPASAQRTSPRLQLGKVDSRVSTITAIEKTLAKAGLNSWPPM